jgi:large subunit ribosomal protein L6
MSRIGRKPIVIPAGVDVKIDEAEHTITVKGPKGTLHSKYHPLMTVKQEGNEILVTRPNDEIEARSLHGLTRTNINNMVLGVTDGFQKELEIQGVGYRCAKQGKTLVLTLGYSHPVNVDETDTIKIETKDATHFVIHGIDKQAVGQFAAEVRSKRPPEPYKGKGIRYMGEFVIHKEGKAGKGKTGK